MKINLRDATLSGLSLLAFASHIFGEIKTPKSYLPLAESQIITGAWVPITRQMTTEEGVSFGWLYDNNLVINPDSSTSYQDAADTDTDNDGFTNGQEYIWGSEPNNPNSFPQIGIDMSKREVFWQGKQGRNYDVISKDSLTKPTIITTNNYSGTNGEMTHKIPEGKKGFYSVDARLD